MASSTVSSSCTATSDAGRLSVMDAVSSHVPTPVHVCARFAGAGLYRGDPEEAQMLAARGRRLPSA